MVGWWVKKLMDGYMNIYKTATQEKLSGVFCASSGVSSEYQLEFLPSTFFCD